MNIFKSLIGRVWQDPNAAEVVKIPNGSLHLIRSDSVRSSRECIYNDAMATIRRVPSVEHNFQLVIVRVFEEDEDLVNDEDETDEERVFLISKELDFHSSEVEGDPSFVWRDPQGDVDEFFEYIAPGTNAPTIAFFETCMYRAMYERKYRRTAPESESYDEFIYREGKEEESEVAVESNRKGKQILLYADNTTDSVETVLSLPGQLYHFSDNGAELVEGAYFGQIRQKLGTFEYNITVVPQDDPGRLVLSHELDQNMNPNFSLKMNAFTWNHVAGPGLGDSWALMFEGVETYEEFAAAFVRCQWETLNGAPWSRAKEDEKNYVLSSYDEDVEMANIEEEDEEEEEVLEGLKEERNYSDDEDEIPAELDDEQGHLPEDELKDGQKISKLLVGHRNGRSYAVRGNKINVFRQNADSEMEYYTNTDKIKTTKGKEFNPREVMLHDRDSKLILSNPAEPSKLYHMDLERGKVVEEWTINANDVPVSYLSPDTKFSQTTAQQTFVGASHNALFRIDPRLSGAKMVDSEYKQYVSKNKFSGLTTTGTGKVAVGSEKGDLRLFDSIGKNAKTALPPLGDPILGVDVTADGRYIVATTKTYLLLIDTLIGEGRYAGSLGFDRSFPATAKPMPKRLVLRNEHVRYIGEVNFSPARFNQAEDAVVTSSGQFVIAWDFEKVKKGKMDKYEIKRYEENIVQDNFSFGDNKNIVVAFDDKVQGIQTKHLHKPSKVSLSGFDSRKSIR